MQKRNKIDPHSRLIPNRLNSLFISMSVAGEGEGRGGGGSRPPNCTCLNRTCKNRTCKNFKSDGILGVREASSSTFSYVHVYHVF